MVHHHRIYIHNLLTRKDESEQQNPTIVHSDFFLSNRKSKLTLLRLFFLFSLLSCTFIFAPRLLFPSFSFPFFSPSFEPDSLLETQISTVTSPCSSIPDNTICCDRAAFRTDLCFMRGDVRTHSPSNSLFLLSSSATNSTTEEKIKPYTRKWETSVMATIDELRLSTAANLTNHCDVSHGVAAVVFSTGGYTGNVYHEFNDGLIPLYITSRHFNKQVVFVILEYHDWWITKYGNVISYLSDYPPIDFSNDRRTHCFPEATVGLKIHDELAIDSARMVNNKTIFDFRRMLDEAYKPRIKSILQEENQTSIQATNSDKTQKPKLVIVSRNGSRAIENEEELVNLAVKIGFRVEVLRPERTTELAKIYRAMNSSDAMVGVHGAAMTHFLFMRPGSVFIQVVPLGTDWAAETYYGDPAVKMGLKYIRYGILPRESSLYREYEKDDPVLRDPESVNAKGWEVTKKAYLDGQNVRLDLCRFRKRLVRAQQYLVSKRRRGKNWNEQ